MKRKKRKDEKHLKISDTKNIIRTKIYFDCYVIQMIQFN